MAHVVIALALSVGAMFAFGLQDCTGATAEQCTWTKALTPLYIAFFFVLIWPVVYVVGRYTWIPDAERERSRNDAIRAQLAAARELLPIPLRHGLEGATAADYENLVEHERFELALEQLVDLGLANSPPHKFWRALLAAGKAMELDLGAKPMRVAEKCLDVAEGRT